MGCAPIVYFGHAGRHSRYPSYYLWVSALAFVAESGHSHYRATTELTTVAADVAPATGPLGSNREYLTHLKDSLTCLGGSTIPM